VELTVKWEKQYILGNRLFYTVVESQPIRYDFKEEQASIDQMNTKKLAISAGRQVAVRRQDVMFSGWNSSLQSSRKGLDHVFFIPSFTFKYLLLLTPTPLLWTSGKECKIMGFYER
jgi:hypothetical protein